MAKTARVRRSFSLERARTACVTLAVVLCALMVGSSRWSARVSYVEPGGAAGSTELAAKVDGGALVFHRAAELAPADHLPVGFDFAVDRRWQDEVTLAWRPYHVAAQSGFAAGATHHGFVFPLWLIVVPVTVAAAYLQGVVVGLRRADNGRCPGCGYSRMGLAKGAACPECGKAAPL
jgi:hypothetical protein